MLSIRLVGLMGSSPFSICPASNTPDDVTPLADHDVDYLDHLQYSSSSRIYRCERLCSIYICRVRSHPGEHVLYHAGRAAPTGLHDRSARSYRCSQEDRGHQAAISDLCEVWIVRPV